MGGCLGLYGFTFVDFGSNHTVIDPNNEDPKFQYIESITKQEHAIVSLCEYYRNKANFQVGDIIEFKQVRGMEEINGRQYKIQEVFSSSYAGKYRIGDTSQFSDYLCSGIVTQVKVPFQVPFKSLEESLQNPYGINESAMPIISFETFDLSEQLHSILLAVLDFYSINKKLPQNLNQKDAQRLLTLVNSLKIQHLRSMVNDTQKFSVEEIEVSRVLNTARYAQTQILPVCMFWGGIIAQEVVKLSGYFTPLKQWLHYEFFNCLPKQPDVAQKMQIQAPLNDYAILFGEDFSQKVSKLKILLTGADQTGNEMIKIIGSMSRQSEHKPTVYLEDEQKISFNQILSHSFFRKQDLGLKKSQVLCQRAKQHINLNLEPLKYEIRKENEENYHDDFWEGLNLIISTTENQRLNNYLNGQSVWYEKPIFVCKTKELSSSLDIILPFRTLTYTDMPHQFQEFVVDRSTLMNFVFETKHAIQWAEEYFDTCFVEPFKNIQTFYQDKKGLLEEFKKQPCRRLRDLETLKTYFQINKKKSFEMCIKEILSSFEAHFQKKMQLLLASFPPDHITEHSNQLFWSGRKRCPQIVSFDISNQIHVQFVKSGAYILSKAFNIQVPSDEAEIKGLIAKVSESMPNKLNEPIIIGSNRLKDQEARWTEQQKQALKMIEDMQFFQLSQSDAPNKMQGFQIDDLTNFHMEFVHAAANLRANCYRLGDIDKFSLRKKLKRNPQKIMTTVGVIVGSLGIQIIKYLLEKPIENFRSTLTNLSISAISQMELQPPILNKDKEFDPVMCGPVKVAPKEFSIWDKIQIHEPMLLCDFLEHFKVTYGLDVMMVNSGQDILYNTWSDKLKNATRLTMSIEDVITEITKKEVFRWKKSIALDVSSDKDGVDYLIPTVKYYFGPKS